MVGCPNSINAFGVSDESETRKEPIRVKMANAAAIE